MNDQTQNVPTGVGMTPAMELALQASFGSWAQWREAFVTQCAAAAGKSGQVRLAFSHRGGNLFNEWVDHTGGASADSTVLLSMPLEKSHSDTGTFVDSIDWAAVYTLYQDAVHAHSEACGASQGDVATALVLDVRREGIFQEAVTQVPNSRWYNPALVGMWAATLPKDRDIIVYCIYGHEVGRSTAMRLRAAGLQARYLAGGIDAWQAAGLPLVPKQA